MRRPRSSKTARGFRSGYEERVYDTAIRANKQLDFERSDTVLVYTKPSRRARYTPDFVLPNGVLVETKGRLTADDRQKMVNVKRDNPKSDIRFLFMRGNCRITKSRNSMTYEDWAEKHGFLWAIGETIPEEWWDD